MKSKAAVAAVALLFIIVPYCNDVGQLLMLNTTKPGKTTETGSRSLLEIHSKKMF